MLFFLPIFAMMGLILVIGIGGSIAIIYFIIKLIKKYLKD